MLLSAFSSGALQSPLLTLDRILPEDTEGRGQRLAMGCKRISRKISLQIIADLADEKNIAGSHLGRRRDVLRFRVLTLGYDAPRI